MSEQQNALLSYQLDDFAAACASALAPAFAAGNWVWSRCAGAPNAAQIAVRLRQMMADVQMDHNLSTGRLQVHRYVDEFGDETIDVSLHLGTIRAEPDPAHRADASSTSKEDR